MEEAGLDSPACHFPHLSLRSHLYMWTLDMARWMDAPFRASKPLALRPGSWMQYLRVLPTINHEFYDWHALPMVVTPIITTHLRFKQITVYPYAFACLLSWKDGGHDGAMCIQSGRDIRRCDAHFGRGTIWFTSANMKQVAKATWTK